MPRRSSAPPPRQPATSAAHHSATAHAKNFAAPPVRVPPPCPPPRPPPSTLSLPLISILPRRSSTPPSRPSTRSPPIILPLPRQALRRAVRRRHHHTTLAAQHSDAVPDKYAAAPLVGAASTSAATSTVQHLAANPANYPAASPVGAASTPAALSAAQHSAPTAVGETAAHAAEYSAATAVGDTAAHAAEYSTATAVGDTAAHAAEYSAATAVGDAAAHAAKYSAATAVGDADASVAEDFSAPADKYPSTSALSDVFTRIAKSSIKSAVGPPITMAAPPPFSAVASSEVLEYVSVLTTSPNGGARGRRKWADNMELPLLEEIVANKSHLPEYVRIMERFDAVAAAPNKSCALPWKIDGKHCSDRWRLLSSSRIMRNKALAAATDQKEAVKERDVLLSNLVEEREGFDESLVEKRSREVQCSDNLVRAGKKVRDLALRARGDANVSGKLNETHAKVVAVDVEGAQNRRRDSCDARASAGTSATLMSRTDVFARMLEIEENKAAMVAEEKAAEHTFRESQTDTLARIASALDPMRTLELQEKMLEDSNAHQLATQKTMMDLMKEILKN